MSEFKIPILFLIFNRLETTEKVFTAIKKIQPKKLYIAADGPREGNLEDKKLCEETRKILDQIDWKCSIKTLFRDNNLGCKIAVSSAISWFFENEDLGIIIEDDCLPDLSFFYFCECLLEKYKNDERIMMITGTSYLMEKLEMEESYFFSYYYPIWGWATWKRAWELYDIMMQDWEKFNNSEQLLWIYKNKKIVNFLSNMFKQAYYNKIDTWDIQWFYSCLLQNGLCITPKYNLISNIGKSGSHTSEDTKTNFLNVRSLDFNNTIHPKTVMPYYRYNKVLINNLINLISSASFFEKIKSKLIYLYRHKYN